MRSASDQGRGSGQLLQELEALSHALYKSQSIPTAPSSDSIPPPRREFDHLAHRRRVSEAAGRPPRSSAPPETRHSISEILVPESDSSGTGAIPAIPQEKPGQQDDQGEESVIDLTHKKKGGIWSWKPLRALAHIGQQRIHCEFSAHVHCIDTLPSSMNGLRLQVHLRHRETGVHTAPVRVSASSAEFEEVLHFRCSVYASSSSSKSKSSGSIKYMSKSFTLSVIPVDVEELDLGKHQLDLSRILPSDSLPTPSQDSSSTGSWSTSFKLSGKARGGVLWVTLGYRILESGGGGPGGSKVGSSRFGFSPGNLRGGVSGSRSFNSLPSSPHTSMNVAPGVLKQSGKPAAEFGSPAMSEPGNEYGDMEQLDLDQDDPPRLREFGGKDSNSNSNSNLNVSSSWKPPLPGKKAIETVEHRGRPLFGDGARSGSSKVEDEGEFSVVEHGVETSVLDEQDRNVFEEQKEEQEEDEDEVEDKALPVEVVDQTNVEEEAPEELKQQDVDDGQEDNQEQEEAAVEEEENEQVEEAAEEEREEEQDEKPGEEPEPEQAEPAAKIGLESYDWKRELEEDDLYDSLQNPSPKSSAAVPVDDYWKPEEQSEVDKYWKQQEDQSDVEKYWKREEPNEVEVEVPVEDLYKIEYQGGESEDEGGGGASEMKGGPGDDLDDLVADEFLDMLSPAAAAPNPTSVASDEYVVKDVDEPDSPRALLLKQFEQEALLDGGFGMDIDETDVDEAEVAAHLSFGSPIVPAFNLDEDENPPGKLILQQPPLRLDSPPKENLNRVGSEEWISDEDKELAAIMDAAETELQKATQAMKSKARAKMLEDAEAEALLQEWGLDENVFHEEEPTTAAPSDEPTSSAETSIVLRQGLPALAPGMGPSVPTADGGSLRSMDSSHFQNGKNDGKLVMHVSKPVVVPAEMGSTAIDVLRNLAAAGTETMAAEAMAAMPLDDVTGKSVQQIALEGQVSFDENTKRYDAALVASNRSALEDGTLALPTTSSSLYQPKQKKGGSSDFLQLDELAPVAMEKIEELAMQGLKIQCDMADEDAPCVLDPVQHVPLLKGSGSSSNLLLAEGSSESSSDGLISMSLSLDEWMRLDAGVDEDEEASDKTKSIMAAHRAAHTTTDLVLNLSEQQAASSSGKMGNTLTLAMLVQLRDPLRNFEPVGAPMMALVEAERVLVPPRPKLWKRVALKGNSEAQYNEDAEEEEVVPQPQFKITGVNMAGLNVQEDAKDSKKKQQVQLWGNQRQQQSGSRWLVANGMTKIVGNKHPLLKSSSKPSKGRQGESSLWSISSRAAPESVQPLTRNPDVKFSKMAAASGFRKR